jgi:AraC-like DNA-binding protein
MEGLAQIDMMARGGALALLALWVWLLIRDHRATLAARLAIAMCLGIACHVIVTIAGQRIEIAPIELLVQIGAGITGGLFWLFARAWFNDETAIGWRSWALIAIMAAAVTTMALVHPARTPLFYTAAVTMRLLMFGFAAGGLCAAWQGRDGDLVETRRGLRLRMIVAVGLYVVAVNTIEMGVYSGPLPRIWLSLIEIGILLITFSFCAAMFASREADLFASPGRAVPAIAVTPTQSEDPLAARLLTHMETMRPYRDETLTVAGLAAQLGEPEYRLRRIVNGALGHRNFAAFLNGYRLAEVKQALADPEQREVPILTIALDAGFGSLGPFNRAFREAEGMTPSAWRVGRLG